MASGSLPSEWMSPSATTTTDPLEAVGVRAGVFASLGNGVAVDVGGSDVTVFVGVFSGVDVAVPKGGAVWVTAVVAVAEETETPPRVITTCGELAPSFDE